MMAPPVCVLYTQDGDLARRLKAFLRSMCEVRRVADADRFDAVLQQAGPAVLFVDLRVNGSRDVIEQVQTECPQVLIIALGTPQTEPMRDAEQSGIYAAEDLHLERPRLQSLAARAFEHLRVLEENRELREETALVPVRQAPERLQPVAADRHSDSALPLLRFPRIFRRFDNIEAMLASVVESVSDACGVTRVGSVFAHTQERSVSADCGAALPAGNQRNGVW